MRSVGHRVLRRGERVRIDLLYVPGCPNRERTRGRLREALAATGIDAAIREIEVTTPQGAADAGMRGSPTILINGRDCFVTSDESPSLSCRLYATDGGLDGAPTVAQLVAALTA
jgi:hypothetical protein